MGKYGPDIGPNVGSAAYPKTAVGPHNFQRSYYKASAASGSDVRAHYEDLYFNNPCGGEVLRVRGIANGLLCATGGTINAIHATGRVAAAKTVSGALNAIRATLEVAGDTPSPGGTLAALQLDTNISTGWTEPAASFIRVTNSGAGIVHNLLSLPALGTGLMVAAHTTQTNTHSIKILVGGVQYYIPIHATASGLG
jgi:hypothetical protein